MVTVSDSEETKQKALESSGMALWSAYCDKKMALEEAEDRIVELEQVLRRALELHDIEQAEHPTANTPVWVVEARELLKNNQ